MAGSSENKAKLAQLGLELGLSLTNGILEPKSPRHMHMLLVSNTMDHCS